MREACLEAAEEEKKVKVGNLNNGIGLALADVRVWRKRDGEGTADQLGEGEKASSGLGSEESSIWG